MVLDIALIIFLLLELGNVVILYKDPGFKYGNSLTTFTAYDKSLEDQEVAEFTKYLYTWVANTKMIFILIMLSVVIFGDEQITVITTIAMLIGMTFYYTKMHPIIKQISDNNQLTIKGYDKTLDKTIAIMMLGLSIAIIITILT